MKKFLLLFGLIACFCACGPLDRCEYLCTIDYSIDGIPHTEDVTLHTGDLCIPAYICGNQELKITAVPTSYWHDGYIVYKGSLPITVERFNYKLVREYKVSSLSGKEIKKKNKH